MKKYYCKYKSLKINKFNKTLESQEYFKIGLNSIKIHLESENSTKTNKQKERNFTHQISAYTIVIGIKSVTKIRKTTALNKNKQD